MGQGLSSSEDFLRFSSNKPDLDHVRIKLLGKDGQRFGGARPLIHSFLHARWVLTDGGF